MIRVFCGYDPRESIGFHVFMESLIEQSPGVSVIPLTGGRGADGSNAFTYSRFDVPRLCGYQGYALWLDGSDMLVRANLKDLFAFQDPAYAVRVVKHDYKTRHPRKYIGTPMETDNPDYPCKNWSSVILWNCSHPSNRRPMTARTMPHRFPWLHDADIGELPKQWNWLADEYGPNQNAKLLHWTAGIPGFAHYANAPHAGEWWKYAWRINKDLPAQACPPCPWYNQPEVCR